MLLDTNEWNSECYMSVESEQIKYSVFLLYL